MSEEGEQQCGAKLSPRTARHLDQLRAAELARVARRKATQERAWKSYERDLVALLERLDQEEGTEGPGEPWPRILWLREFDDEHVDRAERVARDALADRPLVMRRVATEYGGTVVFEVYRRGEAPQLASAGASCALQ